MEIQGISPDIETVHQRAQNVKTALNCLDNTQKCRSCFEKRRTKENEPTIAASVSNGKRKFLSTTDSGTQRKTFCSNFNKSVTTSKERQERPHSSSQYRKPPPQRDKIPLPTG